MIFMKRRSADIATGMFTNLYSPYIDDPGAYCTGSYVRAMSRTLHGKRNAGKKQRQRAT